MVGLIILYIASINRRLIAVIFIPVSIIVQ